jgi:hypothetical protein
VGPQITGADAIQAAVARVRAGSFARPDDTRPWTIVAGAGTYGDVFVDEPNLTLMPSAGAAVAISGSGGADGTGGGCIDVARGGVVLQGLVCRAPRGRGIEVRPPFAEGGVAIRQVTVDRAGSDGIAVLSGAGVLVQDTTVTQSRRDGVRLEHLTGPGPYRIQGGRIDRSGDDGIDLFDDAQRVQVAGVGLDANRDTGLESDDSGSTDLSVDASVFSRNGTDGVFLARGARLAVTNSVFTRNGKYGIELGGGNGIWIRSDRFDGTDQRGDLAFSPDNRTAGLYDGLAFLDTQITLPGEPRGVVLAASTGVQRLSLTQIPAGFASLNRFVRVKDSGSTPTSSVTLRFDVSPNQLAPLRLSALQVYEDDRPGNRGRWLPTTGTRVNPAGAVEVTLGDRDIASGSDSRFAVYAPLGPPNVAPSLLAVYPRPGGVVRGRRVLVGAQVGDDEALGTGRFALFVDGRRRGGVSWRNGLVRFDAGRLRLGRHRAELLVVDASGLRSGRTWFFTVRNARPTITRRRAHPRPNGFVLSHRLVRIRVPVHDDLPLARGAARVRVDGRLVRSRIAHGRLVARVALRPGRHRLVVTVRDRDGLTARRGWTFRSVRP